MKTITIIGVNYFPEDSAIGLYTTQLAEYLAKNDFQVNVITGFPYYPSWRIRENYKNKSVFLNEKINGVNIFRYRQYVPKNPNIFRRIVHQLDFTFGSLVNLFKIRASAIVLCIVPFTSTMALGKLLAKLKGAKLWIHIQDFELGAASESQVIAEKSLTFKLINRCEKFLLNRADILSTISPSMLNRLKSKTDTKILKYLLPNWANVSDIDPKKAQRHSYLLSDKFKILYSGNIGEKQDWQLFTDVAKALEANREVEIIIVGDGAKKDWLLKEIKGLSNVSFYTPVNYSELPDLLCSADLHILFQKNEIIDTVMPSKILGMMASEKPSLIVGNLKSEVAAILKDSSGGIYLESSQKDVIVAQIESLFHDNDETRTLGINARKYIIENFSSEEILKRFLSSVNSMLTNK